MSWYGVGKSAIRPFTSKPAIIPIKGSIVAPVTTAETPPTKGSAFIASGALLGNIIKAPNTSKNPVTA